MAIENPYNTLRPERAYALATRLTLIPQFPNREEAIQAVSEWLLDHCTFSQAERLVATAILEWKTGWTGLWDLEALRMTLFPEARVSKLPSRCPECSSSDWIFTAHGVRRCRCPRGRVLAAQDPPAAESIVQVMADGAPWDPPSWSDPPTHKPKASTQAVVRVTQQEIETLKEQQRLNRKESA